MSEKKVSGPVVLASILAITTGLLSYHSYELRQHEAQLEAQLARITVSYQNLFERDYRGTICKTTPQGLQGNAAADWERICELGLVLKAREEVEKIRMPPKPAMASAASK